MACVMGIDVGTSATKTVIFRDDGSQVSSGIVQYGLSQPHPGWAEQNPRDWWNAVAESIRQAIAGAGELGVRPQDIAAVGLSGQMHGAVCLDVQGQVIRPAIIWCDQRSASQCNWMTEHVGENNIIEWTGSRPLPNFTATKILWLRDNEPSSYDRIARVLLPKDYIRWMLTGDYATDVSDASGTLFLDVRHRRWSSAMVESLGMPMDWLPRVIESPEVAGHVTRSAALSTGLVEGTPVVAGAGDQAAGAVGSGVVEPGIVSTTIGTSGVVFAATEGMRLDSLGRLHSFCHAVPGMWHVMGVTQAAGGSLQWFRRTLSPCEEEVARATGQDVYDYLSKEAETVPPGCEGLVFLPYLMGERTPHLDPCARGAFVGLTSRHKRAHMVRAIMEGVTFSLRDCMQLVEELGISMSSVIASGGGSRSTLWRQMQADVFGKGVAVVASAEGAAFGAALLAGVGVGMYSTVQDACRSTVRLTDVSSPHDAARKAYDHMYGIFSQLYLQLSETMHALGLASEDRAV